MTKKLLNLITGSFALICSVSLAQPTLTATGINSVIGETFTLNGSAYVSPGNAGANQTWNLAAMSGSSAGLTTVVDPTSTVSGASFPNANVAWDNPAGYTVSYYKTSATAFQNYGMDYGGTIMPYSDPEDFLRFPCTYISSFNDNWAVQFDNGYIFYRTGTTTVTADGYGTLITPIATYTNVMRVHFVQVYQDSADVGGPYIITYNNDEYMWYKEGVHVPISTVYTLTYSGGSPITGGSFVTGNVGIDNSFDLISSVNLFPNPASDYIVIENTSPNSDGLITINSIQGQLLIQQSLLKPKTEINISELAKGDYVVRVKTEKGIVMKTFIKE